MSGPLYARLASRVIEEGGRGSVPPPTPENRASAIALLEQAIAKRAQGKRRSRWVVRIGALAAAAAVVVATVGVARQYGHRDTVAAGSAPAGDVLIVGHAVSGAATVVVAGQAAAVTEGRPLVAGSRVVTEKTGRVLLAFSTGTSVLLDGGDATLDSLGASERIHLDSGSLELHVAKQGPGQHFVVRTLDSEVEVRGTQFRVSVAPADPSCGGGTTTRVAVSEGLVVVRHGGTEARVGAGEQWPADCGASASAGPVSATGVTRTAPTPSAASTLGEQNDLFAQAIAAKRRGDTGGAVAGFDRFLARYPGSPLAESATVERMRLLRSSGSSRAVGAARAYLARYPSGFAHSEAEALVAGTP